jgi:hypothetical protein
MFRYSACRIWSTWFIGIVAIFPPSHGVYFILSTPPITYTQKNDYKKNTFILCNNNLKHTARLTKVRVYMDPSPSIIGIIKSRRMTWAGHAARMGEKRNAYRTLVGQPEGKRPLGRPRPMGKMDLREIG